MKSTLNIEPMYKITFIFCILAIITTPSYGIVCAASNHATSIQSIEIRNPKVDSPKRYFKLKKIWKVMEGKKLHIFATAAIVLALVSVLGGISLPILLFRSGVLIYEFGYATIQIALAGIFYALKSLRDIQEEPDKWSGSRRAKLALSICAATIAFVVLWFGFVLFLY